MKKSTLGWMLGGLTAGLAALVAAVSRTTDNPPTTERNDRPVPRTEAGLRAEVVRIAGSQLGVSDPSPYWADAFGTGWTAKQSWCGVFALWALRQAGLTDAKWITGKGFIYPIGLKPTMAPKPGDIAYFDENQHQAIVAAVNPDQTVTLINGNGKGKRVSESRTPIAKVTAFFSIDPLIKKELGQ